MVVQVILYLHVLHLIDNYSRTEGSGHAFK